MKQITIKKGDKFVCIKKVVMKDSKTIQFKKGHIYTSEINNCITNESKEQAHYWNVAINRKYFVKIKTE